MSTEGTITENEAMEKIKGRILTIPQLDKTLTKSGACAEAKAVGDAIADLQRQINELIDGGV